MKLEITLKEFLQLHGLNATIQPLDISAHSQLFAGANDVLEKSLNLDSTQVKVFENLCRSAGLINPSRQPMNQGSVNGMSLELCTYKALKDGLPLLLPHAYVEVQHGVKIETPNSSWEWTDIDVAVLVDGKLVMVECKRQRQDKLAEHMDEIVDKRFGLMSLGSLNPRYTKSVVVTSSEYLFDAHRRTSKNYSAACEALERVVGAWQDFGLEVYWKSDIIVKGQPVLQPLPQLLVGRMGKRNWTTTEHKPNQQVVREELRDLAGWDWL